MNQSVISTIIEELHANYQSLNDGDLADYIPELTKASPDWFGICIITADGHVYEVGDSDKEFTIQSVSKAFSYGMILDEYGFEEVSERIGVEPSGEAFNSISLDPVTGRPLNPMINAGAITATGMVRGKNLEERFEKVRSRFSEFAARDLEVDEAVYHSESKTGFRNRAIANLLRNFEMLNDPVDEAVEVYFKQCSILVNCRDLAVMAASLANGGINPITHKRVLQPENVEKVLSVMSTCGMYDYSGEWIFNVGLPAKSGVGGGILGVLPGQLGVAVFSPKLDSKGNSVRGVATFKELSRRFNLHLFNYPVLSETVIRRTYRLSDVGSSRQRPKNHHAAIVEHGESVVVIEMQGDLFYSATERLIRFASELSEEVTTLVVDLARTGLTDNAAEDLILQLAASLKGREKALIIIDPRRALTWAKFDSQTCDVLFCEELDVALELCENRIVEAYITKPMVTGIFPFHEFDIFSGLDTKELSKVEGILEMEGFKAGEYIVKQGDDASQIYLLAKGSVSIYHRSENPDRRAQRIAAFEPGVCFGDLAVVDGSPRSADVIADTAATCYTLSVKQLNALQEERDPIYPKLIQNILLINVDRLRRCTKEISSLKG